MKANPYKGDIDFDIKSNSYYIYNGHDWIEFYNIDSTFTSTFKTFFEYVCLKYPDKCTEFKIILQLCENDYKRAHNFIIHNLLENIK